MSGYITNYKFYYRWIAIKKFLTTEHYYKESRSGLIIDEHFLIAANKPKMRPLGQIDWAWYTPKTLAKAMDEGTVLQYYEMMLKDKRSDPNKWKNKDEEMQKKALYASRSGAAELL
jgi:hypothetical protein